MLLGLGRPGLTVAELFCCVAVLAVFVAVSAKFLATSGKLEFEFKEGEEVFCCCCCNDVPSGQSIVPRAPTTGLAVLAVVVGILPVGICNTDVIIFFLF